jgi:hypothetical protein
MRRVRHLASERQSQHGQRALTGHGRAVGIPVPVGLEQKRTASLNRHHQPGASPPTPGPAATPTDLVTATSEPTKRRRRIPALPGIVAALAETGKPTSTV